MTRGRRSVADHRAAVVAVLAATGLDPAAPAGLGVEELPVALTSLARDPHRWRDRILAADVVAAASLPLFDNAQMDGYAVRAADLTAAAADAPAALDVLPATVAGEPGALLRTGQAVPIMTGAPMPAGADAVVPIEEADPPWFGDHARVRMAASVPPGRFVRRAGSDVAAGDLLLRAGSALTPAALGVLAAAGALAVSVRRRPRVLLIVTGHEVRQPGETLAPGQIHDANSFSLGLALADAGAEIIVAPCESDDPVRLRAILDATLPGADLLVTVGGVSAGAREVVRDLLAPLGVWFGAVAMQPGGPQGLGTVSTGAGEIPVICFPGNPVSCLVSFEVFLRPLLAALATGGSSAAVERPRAQLPLAEALESPRGLHQVRRGIVDADGRVRAVGGASSHLLHAYARSTVLIHLPAEVERLAVGDDVETWRIDGCR
ncbi:gephyrin-like molybdotransferase Glp [Microbacterium sp.]|uniref:molybdopterin molybdotransferase MoeA n=1 Tax=Microbacterium sp. TaxID=51671 RepID=UPI0025DE4E4A|nr:gephyrin-like molybdotransferase Glp [Microbacterium sp.]